MYFYDRYISSAVKLKRRHIIDSFIFMPIDEYVVNAIEYQLNQMLDHYKQLQNQDYIVVRIGSGYAVIDSFLCRLTDDRGHYCGWNGLAAQDNEIVVVRRV